MEVVSFKFMANKKSQLKPYKNQYYKKKQINF